MSARRTRAEIVESLRCRDHDLVAEALAELLDPAPTATTLLGYTQAQWESLPLSDEARERVVAVFAGGPGAAMKEFDYLAETLGDALLVRPPVTPHQP